MPAGFWVTGGGSPADLSMARTCGRSFRYAAVTVILGAADRDPRAAEVTDLARSLVAPPCRQLSPVTLSGM